MPEPRRGHDRHEVADYELCVCVHADPSPDVPRFTLLLRRDILLLRVDETPNLIGLDALAFQVTHEPAAQAASGDGRHPPCADRRSRPGCRTATPHDYGRTVRTHGRSPDRRRR